MFSRDEALIISAAIKREKKPEFFQSNQNHAIYEALLLNNNTRK